MKAEIIAVGSELLTPDRQDTNSLFITRKLNEAGFKVHLKTIVGDDEQAIARVLEAALQRSTLVIFSGGLGPTEDDLTRPAVAKVLGRALHKDMEILDAMREKFSSRGYRMAPNNERQAEVIEGAEVLPNTLGTAPGMWLEEKGVYIALLPGPPQELQPMIEGEILPRARNLAGGRRLARRSFRITGLAESDVDARIAPVYKTYQKIETTILAANSQIELHILQWLEAGEEPLEQEELARRIGELLGEAIFSTEDESLEEIIGRFLKDSGSSLAVAESCTAGMIGAQITRVPGSSGYFLGGVQCYSNAAKIKFCGVPEELLRKHGAVSAEVAEAMASGIRTAFQSTLGLSITGIAGPEGGTAEKPVGLVYVGVSDGERTLNFRRIVPGSREAIRERACFFALSCLRKALLSRDVSAQA
jgi:nicotinamide-nucleotide amidase